LGLLPQPVRSPSNYRLYTQKDVLRLQRIVALKQQGFQLKLINLARSCGSSPILGAGAATKNNWTAQTIGCFFNWKSQKRQDTQYY
jgi:MerR HTH family regulatory protein